MKILNMKKINNTVKTIRRNQVVIYCINDLHGWIEESEDKVGNPGLAKVAGFLRDEKKQYGDKNFIFISAGDNYDGTAVSNIYNGVPVAEAFKEMNVALNTIGNHEFDWGEKWIPKWAKISGYTDLGANIYKDKKFKQRVDYAIPYKIVELGGYRIGFIGVTTPSTKVSSEPELVKNIYFKSITDSLEEYISIVEKEKVDAIVVVAHEGTSQSNKGAKTFIDGRLVDYLKALKPKTMAKINLILSAHSHRYVNGLINGVNVTQAGSYNLALSKNVLTFTFKKQYPKGVTETYDVEPKWVPTVQVNSDIIHVDTLKDELTPYPPVKKIVDKYVKESAKELDKVIGTLGYVLKREEPQDLKIKFTTQAGAYAADLFRFYGIKSLSKGKGKDGTVAFTNITSLRTDLGNDKTGKIIVNDIWSFMPFNTYSEYYEVNSDSKMWKIIQMAFADTRVPKEDHVTAGNPQVSGIKMKWNKTKSQLEKLMINDKNIDSNNTQENKSYVLIVSNFLADGGDNFIPIIKLGTKITGDGIVNRKQIIKNITLNKTILNPLLPKKKDYYKNWDSTDRIILTK